MFAYAGSSVTQHPFGNWSLSFARQPEPDLDFEEDLAEETQELGGQGPKAGKPPKKKGTSPIVWALLLVLLGGGAYFALDPDGAMNLIGSLMGEAPAPVVQTLPPPSPRPAPPAAGASTSQAPAQAQPTAVPPLVATPSAPQTGALPPKPVPPAAAPLPMPQAAPPSPLAMKTAAPQFGEGQRVTLSSLGSLTLSQDAAGAIPGPTVKPGAILVVLDGDLQASGWVYNVRTETGAKGWVSEKQLRLVP